jgi:hypothetical protein
MDSKAPANDTAPRSREVSWGQYASLGFTCRSKRCMVEQQLTVQGGVMKGEMAKCKFVELY